MGPCSNDWRSTSSFVVYLGANPINWTSKKHVLVSYSTIEAEYHALANAMSDILRIQALLLELQVLLPSSPVIWCDNLSIVHWVQNPILHSRMKHVELDFHFVCEKMINKQLLIQHIPFVKQLAYLLTKSLPVASFVHLWGKLFHDYTTQFEGDYRRKYIKEHYSSQFKHTHFPCAKYCSTNSR